MLGARTERRLHLQVADTTVSTVRPPSPAAPVPPGRLSIVHPHVHPRAPATSFVVAERPFVLGRRGDGEVRHATVSRAHLAIAWSAEAGAHLVRDLDSRNGSVLDGVPLGRRPRALRDGSVLRLGSVLMVWECSAELDEPDRPAPDDVADADAALRDAIPGRALRVQALRAAIARAAAECGPVLLLGETGSGKARVARELHRLSGRTGALISIHCAALPPSQIESALFGHARGGFPDAYDVRRGLFREAHGGTLFLDEIGELPDALQVRLLRAIEDQEAGPVGGGDPVPLDVRVVAATHRPPAEAIAAGQLREDLHARLSACQLHVPPLRARRVDLPDWLVRLHAARSADAAPRALPPLSVDAMETLLIQRWPLNLRAIERLVDELAARPPDRVVEPRDLPGWLDTAAPGTAFDAELAAAIGTTLDASRETPLDLPSRARPPVPSRDEFVAAFEQLRGSVRALARHFARDRRQIYRWIDAHGVGDRR